MRDRVEKAGGKRSTKSTRRCHSNGDEAEGGRRGMHRRPRILCQCVGCIALGG